MIIAKYYSFNNGEEVILKKYPHLLKEVINIIKGIDAEACRLKTPEGAEVNKLIRIKEQKLYSPRHFNAVFDYQFLLRRWFLKPRIKTNDRTREGFREMDALKEKLGLEIQFGKYAFLTYDIVAKMVIFKNFGIIDCGIEICPMASMLPHLSSGIGAFEQLIWDLENRGTIPKFDVPVLVIGVETEKARKTAKILGTDEKVYKSQLVLERYKKLNEGTIKLLAEVGIEPE